MPSHLGQRRTDILTKLDQAYRSGFSSLQPYRQGNRRIIQKELCKMILCYLSLAPKIRGEICLHSPFVINEAILFRLYKKCISHASNTLRTIKRFCVLVHFYHHAKQFSVLFDWRILYHNWMSTQLQTSDNQLCNDRTSPQFFFAVIDDRNPFLFFLRQS